MAREDIHNFLAELLDSEEGRERIRSIWEDITTQRQKRVTSIDCPRCKEWKKVDIVVDKYDLKEINSFLKFAAEYGPGKPVQRIEQTTNVRLGLPAFQNASIEELRMIAEGPRELDP